MYVSSYNKIAVYTAIFGNYDEPPATPLGDSASGIDFICFSDVDMECPPPWKVVVVKLEELMPVLQNRKIKFLGHNFLIGYDSIIYIDGNVVLNSIALDITKYLSGNVQFVFVGHPERSSLLSECIACIVYKGLSIKQTVRYIYNLAYRGYRDQLPLTANRFFARRVNSTSNALFEKVFNSYLSGPPRDQLHLQFNLWKASVSHYVIDRARAKKLFSLREHVKSNSFLSYLFLYMRKIIMWIPLFIALKLAYCAGIVKGRMHD
jgi:hypothetical protein